MPCVGLKGKSCSEFFVVVFFKIFTKSTRLLQQLVLLGNLFSGALFAVRLCNSFLPELASMLGVHKEELKQYVDKVLS